MTETNETKIAVLRADVNAQIDFAKNVEKSLERISTVAEDTRRILTAQDQRLTNAESRIQGNVDHRLKTDDTLNSLREHLMQTKIDSHVERETNHREVMNAINNGHTKLAEEFERKIKEESNKRAADVSGLEDKINRLMQFKWTSLGVASVFTLDLAMRILGFTASTGAGG